MEIKLDVLIACWYLDIHVLAIYLLSASKNVEMESEHQLNNVIMETKQVVMPIVK
jgi:hypothetical protein